MHVDNENKHILFLGEGPRKGLDYGEQGYYINSRSKISYPINFTESGQRFVLSLHYNGSNSFLFVDATKIYQFKGKYSEIKDYALCLDNISIDFTIDNIKKNRIHSTCKNIFC